MSSTINSNCDLTSCTINPTRYSFSKAAVSKRGSTKIELVCCSVDDNESNEVIIMDTADLRFVRNVVDVISVPMNARLR